MRLERLTLQGFRNLRGQDEQAFSWHPHPRFNLIVGDNGQGKTNLLEAVALIGGLRSFRTARIQDCIGFDAQGAAGPATLSAQVVGRAGRSQLGLQIGRAGRKLQIDGKTASSAAAFLGHLTAVVFTPADLHLPHAEPEARRRWLDRLVFNHLPAHLDELRRYEQALACRNALLRAHAAGRGAADPAMLDVYDELLARHGALVVQRRLEVLGEFGPRLLQVFARIAAPGLQAQIRYLPKDGQTQDASRLREVLADRRNRDLAVGHTTRGPHRDDVAFDIADRPAHLHASQGQCRALVLASKIAEITSIEATLGEPPVLLLDDVSSELDAQRNAALMAFLDELGGQVVLTTTDARHIAVAAPRQIFSMTAGCVASGPAVDPELAPDSPAAHMEAS